VYTGFPSTIDPLGVNDFGSFFFNLKRDFMFLYMDNKSTLHQRGPTIRKPDPSSVNI
jgi:hypothetical protein